MKDDPLGQARGRVTLWLDRERMLEARENYWRSFQQLSDIPVLAGTPGSPITPKQVWDISYAAAVAAFDFLMAGKITPG